MSDLHLVTLVALAFGAISFVVYLIQVGVALWSRPVVAARVAAEKAAQAAIPSIGDFTRLLDAIARVADSLSKASPALTSLIAAVLFVAIAAVSSGALRSEPPEARSQSELVR
jgi:hypothetical protein